MIIFMALLSLLRCRWHIMIMRPCLKTGHTKHIFPLPLQLSKHKWEFSFTKKLQHTSNSNQRHKNTTGREESSTSNQDAGFLWSWGNRQQLCFALGFELRDISTGLILLKAAQSLFFIDKKSYETHFLLKSVSHSPPTPASSPLCPSFCSSPAFSLFGHWSFPAFGGRSAAVWLWREAAGRTRRSQTPSAAVADGRAARGFSTPGGGAEGGEKR